MKPQARNALGEGPVDPLSEAISRRDQRVVEMVKAALDGKRAVLAYQPIVQASDPSLVAFHEGLVRILDPTGRTIPAKDFMREVEDTEIGRQIDCLALELGMKTLVDEPSVRLAINMSARSIGYSPWMRTLEAGLLTHPEVADRLILEIEERSVVTTPELVVSFMRDLQGKGISFALDDFGASFTSFRYLRDMVFDIVKIDGQFSRGIAREPSNQLVVESLVSIAEIFDMFTVAESVETADDAQFLATLGVSCLQGYFSGAPTMSPPWVAQERATG